MTILPVTYVTIVVGLNPVYLYGENRSPCKPPSDRKLNSYFPANEDKCYLL